MNTFSFETIHENLLEKLKKRKQLIDKLILYLEKELQSAPTGYLRISKSHNIIQYYCKETRTERKGKYIPKEKLNLARKMAQRDYYKNLLRKLKREQKFLNKTIPFFTFTDIFTEYDKLHPGRKMLVTPVELSTEEYAAKWNENYKAQSNYHNENAIFKTQNNELVRSKSELLIANALSYNKVPYKYEKKLRLKNGRTYYPDFCCLNKRTRQEFFWEHFGLMDSPDYACATSEKISEYAQNGFQQGRQIIFTVETKQKPLTSTYVQKMIDDYLL